MRLKAAKYTPPQGEGRVAVEISSPRPLIGSNNNSNLKRALHLPLNRANENREPHYWYGANLRDLKGSKRRLEESVEGGFGQEPSAAARTKLAELTTIELVELSAVAAEEGNAALALTRARKALEALNQLKARLAQERRKQQDHTRARATTGVGLHELSLMVNSNLAHQLRNEGQKREAIEIYTQLCRMSGSLNATSASGQQHENQTLLYRFGLNIGNIHHELADYQRALKYYRLTLDRLSSAGWANLRVKLMNNISLTLLSMQQTDEAAASLNLLLEDNLKHGSTPVQMNNSNHHKFGLNLVVCHHQRADSSAMLATFKSLVKVNICHHYERVAGHDNEQIEPVLEEGGRRQSSEDNGPMRPPAPGNNRDEPKFMLREQQTRIRPAAGSEWAPGSGKADLSADGQVSVGDRRRQESMNDDRLELLIGERQNQISRSLIMCCNLIFDSDRRGSIVDAKRPAKTNETSVLDLCLEVLQASDTYRGLVGDLKANSIEVMLERGHKLDDAIDVLRQIELEQQVEVGATRDNGAIVNSSAARNRLREPTTTRPPTGAVVNWNLNNKISGGHQWSPMVASTNACLLNLLQGNAARAIEFGHKALQVNNSNVKTLVNLANCYLQLDDLTRAESLWRRALELRPSCWETNHNLALLARRLGRHHDQLDLATRKTLARDWECSSSLFRRNMILSMTQLALIGTSTGTIRRLKEVRQYNHKFLPGHNLLAHLNNIMPDDYLVVQFTVLANVGPSEAYPMINYNSYMISKVLPLTSARHQLTTFLSHLHSTPCENINCSQRQSGNRQQSSAILSTMLNRSKQAPEIHLLASDVMLDDKNPGAKLLAINALQQANKDFPYHLPLAERLIALHIQNFNYDAANKLISACLKNRPDQVKWFQMLAECYRRATNYNKSISTYKNAIESFPQDTTCLKSLIKLFDELGMSEESRLYRSKLDKKLKL